MLKVNKISFNYPNHIGFKHITLSLSKGEVLAVIGESGCGKSTLLKSIYGLNDLSEGKVSWNSELIKGPSEQLVPGYKNFKFLDQEFDLMPYTSVTENLSKFLSRQTPQKNKETIAALLELLDLKHLKDKKVKRLSGGEKQRVALGRALAKQPEVLILDEPFSHIDHFKKHQLRQALFTYLQKQNITCILATHDTDDVLGYSHKTLILKNGLQEDYRPTKKVYNQPKNSYSASLFGEVNTITEDLIDLNKLSTKVKNPSIVYPDELIIGETEVYKAKLIRQLFKGSHYISYMSYQGQQLAVKHLEPLTSNNIRFSIDMEKINKRWSN